MESKDTLKSPLTLAKVFTPYRLRNPLNNVDIIKENTAFKARIASLKKARLNQVLSENKALQEQI
jgi:hypothetical protein